MDKLLGEYKLPKDKLLPLIKKYVWTSHKPDHILLFDYDHRKNILAVFERSRPKTATPCKRKSSLEELIKELTCG